MTDLLLIVAALAALTGALARNITAWVLLGSLVLSEALCWLEVPFNPILWMVIDWLVMSCIIRPGMRYRDLVIIATFLPIWALYIVQPEWWVDAIKVMVAAQMFLTFPMRRALAASQAWLIRLRDEDDNNFEMGVA